MNAFKLNQWRITMATDSTEHYIFTPHLCDEETAMAIAVAQFGSGVAFIADEGAFQQKLTNAQMRIVNPKTCASCGEYKSHEENCTAAVA